MSAGGDEGGIAAASSRILPGLEEENLPFWTGGARDALLIARCQDCGFYLHPPLPRCRRCGGDDIASETVSGRATVASFTINRQAWFPDMATPFVFAAVELVEQSELYVFSNIIGCVPEDVYTGMAVVVRFERDGDVYVPLFAPIAP